MIARRPESFILYEDIDFALMLYRDNESYAILVDILADHLELPLLFSPTTASHQFSWRVIGSWLKKMVKGKGWDCSAIKFHSFPYVFCKYWNPLYVEVLFTDNHLVKMEYFRRILTSAKDKVSLHKSAINEYLSLIICSFYVSPRA